MVFGMKQNKKLVIFDIDGTLIRALRPKDNLQRFRYSIRNVFGIDIGPLTEERWHQGNYNGMGDRAIIWDFIQSRVSRDAFLDHIGEIGDAFVEYLESIQKDGPSYALIPDAKTLVDRVIAAEHLSEGVLTGNLGQSATWKLHSVGLPDFSFGVYGHEADKREDLATLLVLKAKQYFGIDVHPWDIVIIGDTVNDVSCARAIGASVVIVKTGWGVSHDAVANAKPNILVDSLLDDRVLKLLGLS